MQFTIRRLMIAVAVVALLLALERFLFDVAVWAVTTGTEPVILGDAVMVWVFFNAHFAMALGLIFRYAIGRE